MYGGHNVKNRLIVFGKRVMRGMFEPNREEVRGE
jgi:hypothetical protein